MIYLFIYIYQKFSRQVILEIHLRFPWAGASSELWLLYPDVSQSAPVPHVQQISQARHEGGGDHHPGSQDQWQARVAPNVHL